METGNGQYHSTRCPSTCDCCPENDVIVLFGTWWVRIEGSKNTKGSAKFDTNDLKQVFSNVDGIGFMKSMIAFFEQRRIYNDFGSKFGASYTTSNGKRTYIKFKWEGDELVIDNEDTILTLDVSNRPGIYINLELAKKMGWLRYREKFNDYVLGPTYSKNFTLRRFLPLTIQRKCTITLETPVFGRSSLTNYNSASFAIGVS